MDRTDEFQNLLQTHSSARRGDDHLRVEPTNERQSHPPVSTLLEFQASSSNIARDIHVTSTHLSNLTKLVKRRGLFDEDTHGINALVEDIKEGIQGLNSQLDAAQEYVNRRKGQSQGKNVQTAEHSNIVVGRLKVEVLNTTKEFKGLLEARSSSLKAQSERKDMFFGKRSTTSLGKPVVYKPFTLPPPPPHGGSHEVGSTSAMLGAASSSAQQLRTRGKEHSSIKPILLPRPGDVSSPFSHGQMDGSQLDMRETAPLIESMSQQQQAQLIPSQDYLESRATDMQNVERHIAELGQVFGRLATMLQDQREMVENIHDDVENASESVNQGQLALLSTLRGLEGGRMLALKVSGVIFLALVFFFIFLA